MKDDEKEKSDQDEFNLSPGEKFWKKLMETPYDNSKAGQSFVTIPFKCWKADKKSSDKEQEKPEEKLISSSNLKDDIFQRLRDKGIEVIDNTKE